MEELENKVNEETSNNTEVSEQAQTLAQNDPVALSALATNPQLASKAALAKAMIAVFVMSLIRKVS